MFQLLLNFGFAYACSHVFFFFFSKILHTKFCKDSVSIISGLYLACKLVEPSHFDTACKSFTHLCKFFTKRSLNCFLIYKLFFFRNLSDYRLVSAVTIREAIAIFR